MAGTPRQSVQPAAASPKWKTSYEEDFAAQKSSGPVVFTEEQRRKNKELFGRLTDLLPFEDAYKANDCDLIYRFLIGKHWNVGLAEKGLRDYIALRKKDRLDGLIGEQLHPTIGSVLCPSYRNGTPCPIYGLDRDGLPVLWLSPDAAKLIAAMKQFTDEDLLRGQMRAIELGRFVCRARGVDRCTYVIDLGGITMSSVNKATLGFLKGVMNMLQVAYPEIMRRLLIFNTGWAVSAAWKVLRPLVDVRVQDKIRFESGAPSLAALETYMTADQVHPAFGGTGTANVLDPLIEAEVQRVRSHGENPPPPSESATPVRGPSASVFENASLFDFDQNALHSVCSATPGTACPSPSESQGGGSPYAAAANGRVVVGAPRTVSAWLANMGEAGDERDALDMSLSVASSSNDYAVGEKGADEAAGASGSLPADTRSFPPTPSQCSRRASAISAGAGAGATTAATRPPSATTGEPILPDGDSGHSVARPRQQQQQQQSVIAMSLTYGADGSIAGYCGSQCVGYFRDGRLYAQPKEAEAASPSSASASSPRNADRAQSPTHRRSAPAGELLYEAGHPIHNFYIVCDGERRARYLLRRSRLRNRLTVYHVVGGARVRTEKNSRHYVEGERVRLGVAVASTSPSANAKGDWMLFGEDVTQRSAGQQFKDFFSKVKKTTAAAADAVTPSGSGEVEKDAGWPASMLAAISSPSKRKAKAAQREADGAAASSNGGARSPRELSLRRSEGGGNADAVGSQLLAENKGQTVYFYNLLTRSPLPDLFALTVAITLSRSGELEGMRDKSMTKGRRYVSDEDELMS